MWCGLAAAMLFGLGTPLTKALLAEVHPLTMAPLLYGGAALALLGAFGVRSATAYEVSSFEVPLRREDWPWLAGILGCGAVLGPLCMLTGLRQVSGVHGALLLNLEAPLTILLATRFFNEYVTGREAVAGGAIVLGAIGLAAGDGVGASPPTVTAALWCAAGAGCWAVDNNCTQRLSALRDPLQLMAVKAMGGGATLATIAVVMQAPWPRFQSCLGALGVGAVSYGLSLWLDAQALRRVGAARQAAYFATAPFVGAVAAVPLLGDRWGLREWGVAALMALGIVIFHSARHAHRHRHLPLEHTHAHSHEDGHHRHTHAEGDIPADMRHAHPHRHADRTHAHEHLSDLHHRHRHV